MDSTGCNIPCCIFSPLIPLVMNTQSGQNKQRYAFCTFILGLFSCLLFQLKEIFMQQQDVIFTQCCALRQQFGDGLFLFQQSHTRFSTDLKELDWPAKRPRPQYHPTALGRTGKPHHWGGMHPHTCSHIMCYRSKYMHIPENKYYFSLSSCL